MALSKQEAAAIAAGSLTTQRNAAIAADYIEWIDDQDTEATAILSLVSVMRSSKSPAVVLANADVEYARIETDAPTVTSLSPNTGAAAGGTAVTITGKDFTGATAVTFGGTAGTSRVVVNDTTITIVTPAKTAGAYDVVVTTPSGSGTKTNGFTYS